MTWQFKFCTAITRVLQQHTAETAMLIQAKDKDMEDAIQGVSVSLADEVTRLREQKVMAVEDALATRQQLADVRDQAQQNHANSQQLII